MKGYKGFDMNLQCLGFQYEIGKSYKIDGKLEMCKNGFHFCKNLGDIPYWKSGKIRVCEIKASGNIQTDGTKSVCPVIKIVRELSKDELNIGYKNTGIWNSGNQNSGNGNSGNENSGNKNSGYKNSGNENSGNENSGKGNSGNENSGKWNSGNENSGDWNSGKWNSGNWNSGRWNSGDHNSGYFNRDEPQTIRVFEKDIPYSAWTSIIKPSFIHFSLIKWVYFNKMSDKEKEEHPDAEYLNGYLKTMSYKEAFRKSWENTCLGDRELLFELPNFDPKIFEDISGIDVTTSKEWKKYYKNLHNL